MAWVAKRIRDGYSVGMEWYSLENPAADAWLAITADLVGQTVKGGAKQWALVLDARGIPCLLENTPQGLILLVPEFHIQEALAELRRFEQENRDWPPAVPPARPLVENTLATLSVLLLLAVFHNLIQLGLTIPEWEGFNWVEAGSAQAGLIRSGQWWRLVTALTLHADWAHLASNLGIGGIFVLFLCRELGSGLAWSLLIVAGALGNLANAWVQRPTHSSLGASTAVFAAVGILAAINLLRHRRLVQRRWLLPAAAAVALLALLGSEGKNTDLGAHLFGLLFGIMLGLAAERHQQRFGVPSRSMNILLALSSAVVVLMAWWLALITA